MGRQDPKKKRSRTFVLRGDERQQRADAALLDDQRAVLVAALRLRLPAATRFRIRWRESAKQTHRNSEQNEAEASVQRRNAAEGPRHSTQKAAHKDTRDKDCTCSDQAGWEQSWLPHLGAFEQPRHGAAAGQPHAVVRGGEQRREALQQRACRAQPQQSRHGNDACEVERSTVDHSESNSVRARGCAREQQGSNTGDTEGGFRNKKNESPAGHMVTDR